MAEDLEISEQEFSKVINGVENKIVVIDFYSESHMPCLMLSPIIDDISEEMKNIKFAKINVEDNEEIAKKNNITSMPCLVVFKEGKEVGRIIGSHSADILEKKIQKIVEEC